MGRRLDDDIRSRLQAAEESITQQGPPGASGEATQDGGTPRTADALAVVRGWTLETATQERRVTRARARARIRRIAFTVAAAALLAGSGWTAWAWQHPSRFIGPDIFCLAVIALCVGGPLVHAWRVPERDLRPLEEDLEVQREAARILSALYSPSLHQRRTLYQADVVGLVETYEADSRRYRKVHNRLQGLIMLGSAGTTTIAAFDTGREVTWQSVSLTAIGFAITVATAFTGYYKFRERSYFLQQTADAIEEEANALTLGVGPYSDFGPDEEHDALKLFTQRVESHRNEQRRRQQQLDQPAEQSPPPHAPAPPAT